MLPLVEAEFLLVLTAPAAGPGGKLPAVWAAYGGPSRSLDQGQLAFQAAVAATVRPVAEQTDR